MDNREGITQIQIHVRQDQSRNRTDESRKTMIVIEESFIDAGMPTKQAHHREFPEIRGEGETAHECILQLAHHLDRAREHAREAWQRDAIDHAILEVHDYQHSELKD